VSEKLPGWARRPDHPRDIVDLERLVEVQGGGLDAAYVRRAIVDMLGEDDERVGRWDAITGG
jgi:hypothetical protein